MSITISPIPNTNSEYAVHVDGQKIGGIWPTDKGWQNTFCKPNEGHTTAREAAEHLYEETGMPVTVIGATT